jgi:hypothetical protein
MDASSAAPHYIRSTSYHLLHGPRQKDKGGFESKPTLEKPYQQTVPDRHYT